MRALTLTQPWASLMVSGYKRVETRSWRTNIRGPVAIHAAKGFPKDAQFFASEERVAGRISGDLPLGAIIAIATLMGCRRTEDVGKQLPEVERHLGDYSAGRWAWFFTDIKALPFAPISCRGSLGLWLVPSSIEQDVIRQLVTPA